MGFINLPVVAGGGGATIQILTTDVSNVQDTDPISTPADLIFSAAASSKYLLRYYLFLTSTAQAVIRIGPSYPADKVKVYGGMGGASANLNQSSSATPANGTWIGQYIAAGTGTFEFCTFNLYVETLSAGNISFAFNGANGATATTIKAGSFVEITQIS